MSHHKKERYKHLTQPGDKVSNFAHTLRGMKGCIDNYSGHNASDDITDTMTRSDNQSLSKEILLCKIAEAFHAMLTQYPKNIASLEMKHHSGPSLAHNLCII